MRKILFFLLLLLFAFWVVAADVFKIRSVGQLVRRKLWRRDTEKDFYPAVEIDYHKLLIFNSNCELNC